MNSTIVSSQNNHKTNQLNYDEKSTILCALYKEADKLHWRIDSTSHSLPSFLGNDDPSIFCQQERFQRYLLHARQTGKEREDIQGTQVQDNDGRAGYGRQLIAGC